MIREAIEQQAPMLLIGGGIYLIYLFLHWLFLESKKCAFFIESYIHDQKGFWFYGAISTVLLLIIVLSAFTEPRLIFGAITGSTVFFITYGFKKNAEKTKNDLSKRHFSDISKILYLEVLMLLSQSMVF